MTYDRVLSSITVENGKLYFGNRHGLYVLDNSDGSKEWDFAEAGIVSSTPAVVDGSVYFGSHDNHVYALDASDGSQQWTYETGDYVYSSPVVQDGMVVVGSGDGNVYAINPSNGRELWSAQTSGPVNASPALADGTIYIGSRDGNVYALDADDGAKNWTFETGSGIDSSPAVGDRQVYVGNRDGTMYALSTDDGSREWTTVTRGTIKSSPAVAYNSVYVGNGDGTIYALNTRDGTERWSVGTGSAVDTSPVVVDGSVYVGNADDRLLVYDRNTGDIQWGIDIGLVTNTSPAVVYDTVYVGGTDGNVYALREQSEVSEPFGRDVPTPDSPPPEPDSLPPTVTAISGSTEGTGPQGSTGSNPDTNQVQTPAEATDSDPGGPLTIVEYLGLAGIIGGGVYVAARAYINSIDSYTSTSDESLAIDLDAGVSSWLVSGAYSNRSASVPTEPGPATAPTTAWKALPEDDVVATEPTVMGGIAYVVTESGDLLSIDVESGDIQGRTELDIEDPTQPVIAEEGVFVGCEQGIVVLTVQNDDVYWGIDIDRVTSLLASGDALCVGCDNSIQSLELKTGNKKWQTVVDGIVVSTAVDEDTVYAATTTTVIALDRTDGGQRWVEDHQGHRPSLTIEDVLVVSTQQTLSFRDPDTGVELERKVTKTQQTPVALAHNCLYHVTESTVRALNSEGEEVWQKPLDATTPPVVVGKTVYVGTDSDLVALDATNGEYRFTHELHRVQSRPVVVGNTILCRTADGALTAISGELGEQPTSPPKTSLEKEELGTDSDDRTGSLADGQDDVSATGTDRSRDTIATAFSRDCGRIASARVVDDTGPVHVYDGRFVDSQVDKNHRIYALATDCNQDAAVTAFLNTARQWRGISKNTYITSVIDVGEEPRPWVGFDPGIGHLDDQLEPLSIAERVEIITDLAEAIRTAGMYNVVHGALRPEVIYYSHRGENDRTATVADWGLQSAVQRTMGDAQALTPYTAPEQLNSENSNNQTDVYRLGAVAYYILTGNEPFSDATQLRAGIRNGDLTAPSERTPSLPPDVDDVIATAMADDPEQRFASPYDLKRQLRAAMR
ncbi:outer membrane protein assembly factor BamB family protein [Halorientalis regularis]|nr:PQQ-binding-like beta-propeller repeat protein [Halorientalis regularis]